MGFFSVRLEHLVGYPAEIKNCLTVNVGKVKKLKKEGLDASAIAKEMKTGLANIYRALEP